MRFDCMCIRQMYTVSMKRYIGTERIRNVSIDGHRHVASCDLCVSFLVTELIANSTRYEMLLYCKNHWGSKGHCSQIFQNGLQSIRSKRGTHHHSCSICFRSATYCNNSNSNNSSSSKAIVRCSGRYWIVIVVVILLEAAEVEVEAVHQQGRKEHQLLLLLLLLLLFLLLLLLLL